MKKTLVLLAFTTSCLMAAAPPEAVPALDWHNKTLGQALLNSVIFGALGILLAVVGFKVFDKAVTRIDLEAEICKGNLAAAILSGAVIIGICLIIPAAIS